MKFIIIQSGSKGNATLVMNKGRILLIDMGVTLKTLTCALNKLNKNIYNVEAMLLTHDHSDHTSGIKYLSPLPIYTLTGNYDSSNVIEIKPFKMIKIAGFNVTAIKTSHDGTNPCGFIVEDEKERLIYLTDSGYIPAKTMKFIKNADYYIFESNHDVDMLLNTNRPVFLKNRILSNKGHLSNEQSANYLSQVIGEKTKQIVLAHISEEANSPELALKTHKDIYKSRNINLKKIKLICANQHEAVEGGLK